jgi:hypothetical protein
MRKLGLIIYGPNYDLLLRGIITGKSYAPTMSALAPRRTPPRAVWIGPLSSIWSELFFVHFFLFSFSVQFSCFTFTIFLKMFRFEIFVHITKFV